MNDQTLLAYGLRELPAFRADMRGLGSVNEINRRVIAARLRDVLRNADERREAAGLTRDQAERACVLAARAEGKAK